jgi:hypothetical protein
LAVRILLEAGFLLEDVFFLELSDTAARGPWRQPPQRSALFFCTSATCFPQSSRSRSGRKRLETRLQGIGKIRENFQGCSVSEIVQNKLQSTSN